MNQKGISSIVIILIIVGVLGLAGGVWYYLVETTPIGPGPCPQDLKTCPDGTQVGRALPNCEFASCPEVKDETADWKTYQNDEYGFEVKYPSSKDAERVPIIVGPDEGKLARIDIEVYQNKENPREYIALEISPRQIYNCIDENTQDSRWIISCNEAPEICEDGSETKIEKREIKIGENYYPATLISRYESIFQKPIISKRIYACVRKNNLVGKGLSLTFTVNSENRNTIEKNSILVNQILSTFKFTK